MANILEDQSEAFYLGIEELEDLRDKSDGRDREVIDTVLLFADMVSKKRLIRFIYNAIEEIDDSETYKKLLQIATYWREDERAVSTETLS